ncbi:MAG: bifunctional folylpolyglutamate synthase/dihydrofolate synthase [Lachnospiraceae bacterium]|nr:bifunctional folylpolyglutamate synthase/dihydrofolate synthase [Lachnospiraceae bacterium]
MREKRVKSYAEAEYFLAELPKHTVKSPFDKTKGFYEFLQGEVSEAQLGRIIHVAGTNGKGSVCAFLRQIFLESGYHVGMFISPHLITTRERFVIDGDMVSEEQFVGAFNWLADRIDAYRAVENDYAPAYFERLFFMGMYLFAKAGVDITVLETGLGGRLDTTNVIKSPALCVITEIGLDHMEYLGGTVEQIAEEKAGIIKPGVPVVFLERKKEAFDVFVRKASECGSKCYIVSENEYKINEITKKFIDFSVFTRYDDYNRFTVRTPALYQVENAAIAIKACEALADAGGFERLGAASIKAGIENMRWAGRMEEILPNVYIDGAHNEDGMEAFVRSLQNAADLESCMIIFSVVRDKQYDRMIEMLCGLDMAEEFVVTHIPGERGAELCGLAEQFRRCTGKEVHAFEQIEDAVMYCIDKRDDTACSVYIVGSLYLAGAVRRLLDNRMKKQIFGGFL